MTPEERALLLNVSQKLNHLLDIYYRTNFIDKTVFTNPVYFNGIVRFKTFDFLSDTTIITGSTTGTKFGDTGNKIGFLGATPVVRQGAVTTPTGGSTIDAESRTAIGQIKTALTNLGLTA